MLAKLAVIFYCAVGALGSVHPVLYSGYLPAQLQYTDDYPGDSGAFGYPGIRENDQNGLRALQVAHANHAARNYGTAESHDLRDIAQHVHFNRGIKTAAHNSRGQEGHFRKAHDRGAYEREKKFGYEKAFGYERESKQNNKAAHGQSYGSQINQDELLGQYNHGRQAIRHFADHLNRQSHGSQSHADNGLLLDRGKTNFGNDYVHHDTNPLPKLDPMFSYGVPSLRRDYLPGVGDSFVRSRYMSGIQGLGGASRYGVELDHDPLWPGYADVDGELVQRLPAEFGNGGNNDYDFSIET